MSRAPANIDLAVARRILRGDERAFRDLFDSFFPRLYRFALARTAGDRDLAGEIVQQTLCKGLERLQTYRGEAALYTWFCQICRHEVIDHCRKARRTQKVLLEDEPHVRAVLETIAAPQEEQPDNQVWRSDLLRLVQATLDGLPERYGNVLEWKYVDGMPVADIAARLEIGVKAAESLLMRARGAFRAAMLSVAEVPEALSEQRRDWTC